MLGSVCRLECLGATAILLTTRGSRAHRDTPVIVQKSSKRVQQRGLINYLSLLFLFDAYFWISRFEVLISRFFWACFSKPPDLHVMGVGRSGNQLWDSKSWVQHEFDLKSQVWFQTKLCSAQFSCYFIASILKSCIQLNSQNTRLQDFGWYQNLVNKSWKIFQTMVFCLSFLWNVIG